jgi:hypothetical protein
VTPGACLTLWHSREPISETGFISNDRKPRLLNRTDLDHCTLSPLDGRDLLATCFTLDFILAHFFALKKEAKITAEILVGFQRTVRRYIPKITAPQFINIFFNLYIAFFTIYSRYLKREISKRDGCEYLKQVPSSDGSLELI